MHILFVAEEVPWPLDRGDRIRAYHLLRGMGKKHKVTVICFDNGDNAGERVNAIKHICERIVLIPLSVHQMYLNILRHPLLPVTTGARASGSMRRKINELIRREQFDLVYVYQLKMAWQAEKITLTPKIIDYTDALSLYKKRLAGYAGGFEKWWHTFEAARLLQYEKKTVKRCTMGFFASDEDNKYLKQYAPHANLEVLPNGVDTDYFVHGSGVPGNGINAEEKAIIFFGNFEYPPNVDGLKYFLNDIFPSIREKAPGCNLYVVGKKPPEWAKETDKIIVTGYVEDIREYLQKAAVVICPIRFGAGTRIKILEAMAMGKPVVSTSLGCEGIDVNPGQNIEVADEPGEFVLKTVNLLEDIMLRNKIGQEARILVEKKYSWDIVINQLNNQIKFAIKLKVG